MNDKMAPKEACLTFAAALPANGTELQEKIAEAILKNAGQAVLAKLAHKVARKLEIELKIALLVAPYVPPVEVVSTPDIDPSDWVDELIELGSRLHVLETEICILEALRDKYFADTLPAPGTTTSTTTVAGSTSSSTTAPATVTLTATLNGASEVPPVSSVGSGTASLVFNNTTKIAVLTVNYAGITPASAHIHRGVVGVDGLVVFTLDHTQNPIMWTSTPLTPAQESALKAGMYYVNLHTDAYPEGEIRGQLV